MAVKLSWKETSRSRAGSRPAMTPAATLSAGIPAPGRPLKRAARKSVPMIEARTTGGAMPLSTA